MNPTEQPAATGNEKSAAQVIEELRALVDRHHAWGELWRSFSLDIFQDLAVELESVIADERAATKYAVRAVMRQAQHNFDRIGTRIGEALERREREPAR